ncbi:hemin uptake protein HemP [uncultured Methylobacterium sp.]|jgi:hemin uptake protein HemP|uniref:hemin uptake protein HemP n=1 Tax=uncultured Methylobacterium sp. TaxID=157278 RepID=UPI002605AF44|nr:hemin uptake protein HemP [uncultured Methylobacterium sp.]
MGDDEQDRDESLRHPDLRRLRMAPDHDDPVESVRLMRGRRELTILHAGERYRLRVTANDKLILTK